MQKVCTNFVLRKALKTLILIVNVIKCQRLITHASCPTCWYKIVVLHLQQKTNETFNKSIELTNDDI